MEVVTSIVSERLIRVFERLRKERGLPQILRPDNGPEFLGEAFTQWANKAGMVIQIEGMYVLLTRRKPGQHGCA